MTVDESRDADVRDSSPGAETLLAGSSHRATRASVTLLDQAISSATNFIVALVALRSLMPEEFGAFAIAMGFYAIALGVSRGIVSEPLAINYSNDPDTSARRAAVGTSIVVGAAFTAIGLLTWMLLGGLTGATVALVSIFLPFLLAQDACRLLFITDRVPWRAVATDSVWGALALVAMLGLYASRGISLQAAMVAWAAAGSIAALVALAQAGLRPRWDSGRYVRDTWHLGGRFAAEFLVNRGSYEIAIAAIAAIAGLSVLGDVAGARTLFGPVNVVILGFVAFGVPEASRIHRSNDGSQLTSFVMRSGLALATLGPVTAVLLAVAGVGSALSGEAWMRIAHLTIPMALALSARGVVTALTVGLRARAAARESLRASVAAGILLIVLAPSGAYLGGATGAAIGIMTASVLAVVPFVLAFARSKRRPRNPQPQTPPMVEGDTTPVALDLRSRTSPGRVGRVKLSSKAIRSDGAEPLRLTAYAIATAMAAVAVATYTPWGITAAGLLVAGTGLAASWRVLAPGPLSPVKIVVVSLMTSSILGPVAYSRAVSSGRLPRYLEVSEEATALASESVALLAGAVAVGAMAALIVRQRRISSSGRAAAHTSSPERPRVGQLAIVLMVPLIPVSLLILGSGGGPSDFLARSQYIATTAVSGYERAASPAVFGLGLQGATIGVVALGYMFMRPTQRYVRVASVLSAATVFAVFVALGSRRLALVPVLFAFGAFAATAGSSKARRNLAIAAVVSVAIVGVAWFLRGQASHGLLPYVQAIVSSNPAEILELTAIEDNVSVLFAQVASTGVVDPPVPEAAFWVSVNPLPGFASGWYEVAPDLRLNAWTPYPAVGQLANHGWPWLIAYGLAVGGILGFVESGLLMRRTASTTWTFLVAAALAAMFTLFTLQYNLRSASRAIWYALGAYGIYLAYLHIRRRRAAADAVWQRPAASIHQHDHVGV